MDSEVGVHIGFKIIDTCEENLGQFLVNIPEHWVSMFSNYIFQGFSYIITLISLELQSKYKSLFNKVALDFNRYTFGEKAHQVDCSAHVNTPTYLFNNILVQFESLFVAHLSILTSFSFAAALIRALNL